MSNVVLFTGISSLPLDPDRLLDEAIGKLDRVLIIGVTKDGDEYFKSSDPDGATCIWDMERAKLKLLKIVDEMTGKE
jgi:hypothetical protein